MKTLQMIFGVIIGITGTLLLTLNVWGTAWYQVIISLFVGVILGLFVADYKVASRIVISATKKSTNYVIRNSKNLNLKNSFIKSFKLPRLFSIVVTFILVITACYFLIFGFNFNTFQFYLLSLCFSFFLGSSNIWKEMCPDKILKVIWGKHYSLSTQGKIEVIVININNVSFISAFLRSICCGIVSLVLFLAVLLFLIYLGIVWLFSIILGIALSPIYIIKKISQCSFSLTIATSIVIGGLIGTFCVSYILGIIAGVGFLIILLAIKKWVPEDYIKIFFRYGRGLPGYMTFGLLNQ